MSKTREQIIKDLNVRLFGVEQPKQLTKKEKLILEGAIAFFIDGAIENTLPVYQLEDTDNMPWGLIRTDAPSDEIAKWFYHYYNHNDEGGLDDLSEEQLKEMEFPQECYSAGFAKLLVIKGYQANAFYVEENISSHDYDLV